MEKEKKSKIELWSIAWQLLLCLEEIKMISKQEILEHLGA